MDRTRYASHRADHHQGEATGFEKIVLRVNAPLSRKRSILSIIQKLPDAGDDSQEKP
jgi:hypothetical protein